MLTHGQIWSAIDALAARRGMSASALAKRAGLDPTSFNRSKRGEGDGRPRWPSTESLSKVLEATGMGFPEFAEIAAGRAVPRTVPLIGLAQAGQGGFFDDAGYPTGEGWDELEAPQHIEGAYALEIAGDSMSPAYRDGDRVVVKPIADDPRRGDRVVVRTTNGEVLAKEVARITANRLELRSLNPDHPDRSLERRDIAWIARILWASQ